MSEGLEAFYKKTLSSDLLADLLVLFRNNPGLVDTPDAIARRLGVSGGKLSTELAAMKRVGLLRQERVGAYDIVSFSRSKDATVAEFVGKRLASKVGAGRKRR